MALSLVKGLLIPERPFEPASSSSPSALIHSSLRSSFPQGLVLQCLPICGFRPRRNGTALCMAHPRRVKMVAQQIKRELGDMLLRDKVLQHAVLPEAAVGADMYLSSLATISDVEISNDLQVAKVYVSIYSDERGKETVMEGLKARAKYVRAGLGKRMSLRITPEVRFIMDDSLERGSRVIAILNKLQKEREVSQVGDAENDDDDNWDDILDDEGVVDKALSKQKPKANKSTEVDWDVEGDDIADYGEDENIVYIK